MRNFDYGKLKDKKWDSEVLSFVAQIYRLKGEQTHFFKAKPARLDSLIEIAKVQSTEGSNAIEGIRTTNARLRRLVQEKTAPKNRNEEEIAGYRDALNVIHESYEYIPPTPNHILQLHQTLYSHSVKKDIGGKFKSVQNYIETVGEYGKAVTLFTPLPPYETPEAMERICNAYTLAEAKKEIDPLILIPAFIHDFLCIHPFLDGNGRVSRLLTTLLLYRSGIDVGKYISLEAKIAKNKDLYYNALAESGRGWHEGNEDVTPFVKYILGIILGAYRDLEERIEIISENKRATDEVKAAVDKLMGKITKAQVCELLPLISLSSVEKGLKDLVESGYIERRGFGRNTFYIKR